MDRTRPKLAERGPFRCSCCFTIQGKNPNGSGKIAEHFQEGAVYRDTVCPGSQYPPLEESDEGLLHFTWAARKRLIINNDRCAQAFLGKPQLLKSVFLLQQRAKSDAEEIEYRNLIKTGIAKTGSYGAFLGQGIERILMKKEYRYKVLEQIVGKGGFDFLEDELDKYHKNPMLPEKLPFFEFMQENHGIDSLYEYSEWPSEPGPLSCDPAFAWLLREIDIYELLNACDVYGRAGSDDSLPIWLKMNMSVFKDMPV